MTLQGVSLKDNLKVKNTSAITFKQASVVVNNSSANEFQRQPKEDNFNGKNINKKKFLTYTAVGTILTTLIGIALDFRFAEGRHVKKLFGKLTENTTDVKPKTNEGLSIRSKSDINTSRINDNSDIGLLKPNNETTPNLTQINQQEIDKQVQEFFAEEEKLLAEEKNKIKLSDWENERWLIKEHRKKEKEYSEFWNTELDRIGNLTKEAREKEVEKLWEIMGKERNEFFATYKNNIPSEEERYKAFLPLMRIEYGGSFRDNVFEAKQLAKEPENWLHYIWDKTPRGKELSLEYILKKMEPKDLDLYNNAKWILDSKKLQYDKLDLAKTIVSDQRELIEELATTGKFAGYGEVIGHSKAYTINSPLRLGYNVDDTLKVILDEGFRTVEPIENPVTVYRAVSGGKADGSIDFINNLIKAKKGETFIDKGYSYSSFSEKGACSCNGIADLGTDAVKLKIIVPKGARVSNGSHYEQNELLFPRNAEFRVVEEVTRPEPYIYKNDEGKEVKLPRPLEMVIEYILPEI